jgi:hypothetical protein
MVCRWPVARPRRQINAWPHRGTRWHCGNGTRLKRPENPRAPVAPSDATMSAGARGERKKANAPLARYIVGPWTALSPRASVGRKLQHTPSPSFPWHWTHLFIAALAGNFSCRGLIELRGETFVMPGLNFQYAFRRGVTAASKRHAPVICGTASGGFPFAFVRPIVKLFTSWSDTTPPHIAGAPSCLAAIRRADCFPIVLADLSVRRGTIVDASNPLEPCCVRADPVFAERVIWNVHQEIARISPAWRSRT